MCHQHFFMHIHVIVLQSASKKTAQTDKDDPKAWQRHWQWWWFFFSSELGLVQTCRSLICELALAVTYLISVCGWRERAAVAATQHRFQHQIYVLHILQGHLLATQFAMHLVFVQYQFVRWNRLGWKSPHLSTAISLTVSVIRVQCVRHGLALAWPECVCVQ